ncbi:MAG TPA: C-terminal helicase domain-containing protein, partial [Cytophaga sp.]|nr:C-terminal helicase domain-containing protein [Cytophaga sp.]
TFRNGEIKVLIATDISARGIDIPGVEYVVNYDMPEVAENYVHRVGRTGRGVSKGVAISFCSMEEKPVLDEVEEFLGKEIQVIDIDGKEYDATLALTEDVNDNWKALLKEADAEVHKKHIPKKKKKK